MFLPIIISSYFLSIIRESWPYIYSFSALISFLIHFPWFYFCCILDRLLFYFSLPLKPRDKFSNIFFTLLSRWSVVHLFHHFVLYFCWVIFRWIIFYLTHPIQWTRIKDIHHNYFFVFDWFYLAFHWLLYRLSLFFLDTVFRWRC